MSAPQFTPGPWEARNQSSYRNEMHVGTPIPGKRTYTLATIRQPQGGALGTNVANANLIAAAPDLYDALDAAPLPSTLGNREDHYERFYDWYNKVAVPALAKARGEQP